MMFGGIETSEGMTTSLFWHLLTTPGQWTAVTGDPIVGGECGGGILAARAGRGPGRPLRDRRRRAGWRRDPHGRPRHRVVDGGKPRSGDLPGSRTRSMFCDPTLARTWPSPRVRTPASGSTWRGSRPGRRSRPSSTPGPASRSNRTRRHRVGSSSESRARSRSAGTSQVHARLSRPACSRARRCPSGHPWRPGSRRR